MSRIFLSRSEQDQAILLYGVETVTLAAPVVRDRQIANGSGSGDPGLDALSVSPTLARDRPSPYGKA